MGTGWTGSNFRHPQLPQNVRSGGGGNSCLYPFSLRLSDVYFPRSFYATLSNRHFLHARGNCRSPGRDRSTCQAGHRPGFRRARKRTPDVRVFKGIPYAAPPVGDLRWKPPQPALKWEGVRAGDQFGNSCMQGGAGGGRGGARGGAKGRSSLKRRSGSRCKRSRAGCEGSRCGRSGKSRRAWSGRTAQQRGLPVSQRVDGGEICV